MGASPEASSERLAFVFSVCMCRTSLQSPTHRSFLSTGATTERVFSSIFMRKYFSLFRASRSSLWKKGLRALLFLLQGCCSQNRHLRSAGPYFFLFRDLTSSYDYIFSIFFPSLPSGVASLSSRVCLRVFQRSFLRFHDVFHEDRVIVSPRGSHSLFFEETNEGMCAFKYCSHCWLENSEVSTSDKARLGGLPHFRLTLYHRTNRDS